MRVPQLIPAPGRWLAPAEHAEVATHMVQQIGTGVDAQRTATDAERTWRRTRHWFRPMVRHRSGLRR